jgi:nitroreductase
MDIYEAVDSRRSVRDYMGTPVSISIIKKVLETALRSPSGGNLQPWNIHIVNGKSIEILKLIMRERITSGSIEKTEYDIYPPNLQSPYRDRRFQIGEALYGQLAIPREDKEARQQWFLRNFEFFGAPVGLFFTIDRSMGSPQWADLGMIMQTIMLLLKAEGLDSCAQECWALYPEAVGEFLNLPNEQMLFAGMSVGYANNENEINQLRTERASMNEAVKFYN